MIVLDSSAVLAVLLDEAGAAVVIANLSGEEMSIVNAREVLTKTFEQGGDPTAAMNIMIGYGIHIGAFSRCSRHSRRQTSSFDSCVRIVVR